MVVKSKVVLTTVSLLALAGWLASVGAAYVRRPSGVRVAIIQNAPTIKIAVRGAYEIFTLNTGEELSRGKNLWTSVVVPTAAGIKIRDKNFKVYGVKIKPATSGNIYINGRRFRGEINIIRQKDIKLLVVNCLGLEEYIKGVLSHEVSHRWPLDAIKAQAVVARTFAVYQTQISAVKDYDLTSDIYSQVYWGKTAEKWRTSRATDATKGEVLTYRGKIFPTFYHATCGGHTEDASILWKVDLPPLKGVACPFCEGSPHFKWHAQLSAQEIENKLVAQGKVISGLEDITVKDKDNSGRVLTLKLIAGGNSVEISGKDFRQIFNPNIIRSTDFEINKEKDKFRITGTGWGHGVGMCQWGAYFMSLKGKKYAEILRYYYPGVRIEKLR